MFALATYGGLNSILSESFGSSNPKLKQSLDTLVILGTKDAQEECKKSLTDYLVAKNISYDPSHIATFCESKYPAPKGL